MAHCATLHYMRTTLNISIPPDLKREVDKEVKDGNYASVSEFFRDALREWSNTKLVRDIRRSQLEALSGKTKVLRSLRDLR